MSRFFAGVATVMVAALVSIILAVPRAAPADPMAPSPAVGYTLHVDADQHFGDASPNEIAHHWCKPATPELTECLLYDSDGPGAKLIGVETIVPTAVWKTFPPSEQALWHYHRIEIKKVHATLPGLSPAEAAKVIDSISETYGKVWILWDPARSKDPIGQPSITILK